MIKGKEGEGGNVRDSAEVRVRWLLLFRDLAKEVQNAPQISIETKIQLDREVTKREEELRYFFKSNSAKLPIKTRMRLEKVLSSKTTVRNRRRRKVSQ